MALNLHVVALLLVGVALPAAATCPMFDSVRYQDLDLTIHKNTNFPESSAYSQWARTWSFCSAINQGRAVYGVAENKVFLLGFRACGSERAAVDIYPGATDRVAASWLNGELEAYGGKSSCLSGMCPIGDTKFTFTVQDGVVTSVRNEPSKECRGAK
jgi:hypothetical protein